MAPKRTLLTKNRSALPKEKHRFGLTEWLSIAQLAALLFGGAWAAFIFWKFDSRDRDLSYQKSQIELKRLKASPLSIGSEVIISENMSTRRTERLHNISISYSLENNTYETIKVTVVAIQVFALPLQKAPPGEASELLSSDNPESKSKLLLSHAYLADDETLTGKIYKSSDGTEFNPVSGGGGTGFIEPKNASWARFELRSNNIDAEYLEVSVEAVIRLEDKTETTMHIRFPVRFRPGVFSPALRQQESKSKSEEKDRR